MSAESNKGKPEKSHKSVNKKLALDIDPDLAKIADQVYISLVEFNRIPKSHILKNIYLSKYTTEHLESKNIGSVNPVKKTNSYLVYRFENTKRGLLGYIGKDLRSSEQEIIFVIIDKSRIKWARTEGFVDSAGYDLEFIHTQVGTTIRVADFDSFVNFLSGSGNYLLVGEYLKS